MKLLLDQLDAEQKDLHDSERLAYQQQANGQALWRQNRLQALIFRLRWR